MATLEEAMKSFLGFIDKTEYCWFWTGYITPTGYGYFTLMYDDTPKKNYRAHRLSWIMYKGDIPEGKEVLHKCGNKICVNPEHLYLGTQIENLNDYFLRARLAREIGISEISVGLIENGKIFREG